MALLTGTPAGRSAEARLPPDPRYKLLVVAAPKCEDKELAYLPNAIPSGKKLAEAMRELRYEVTVLEGDKARADNVLAWLDDNASPKKADLVILALVGHGGQRNDRFWFLTSEATKKKGGLSLEQLDARGLTHKWPLVIIADACRGDLLKQEGPMPPLLAGASPVEEKMLMRGPVGVAARQGEAVHRTHLFAVRPGQLADDKNDLMSVLADGLQIDGRRFRADPWSRVSGAGKASGSGHLSLRSWFLYAIQKHMVLHDFRRLAEVEPGSPVLDVLLAQADPPGPPLAAPAVAPERRPGAVNLLELWRPQHGHFTCQPALFVQGLEFTAPANVGNEPWKGGHVAEQGEGFDTRGKAVFFEILAVPDPLEPFPPDTISIGLDVKSVDQPRRDVWIAEDGQKAHRLLSSGRSAWCKIPLRAGERLNYLGISDIPAGCVVTVQQVWLSDARLPVPPGTDGPVNLLVRWRTGDAGQFGPNGLRFGIETVEGERVLHIGKGKGWVGGVLSPPLWANEGSEVEVVVDNSSGQRTQALLELKQGYDVLGGRILQLPPGRSTQRIPVKKDGLGNYFAVSQPSADLIIHSLVLKPGSPNVAREK